MGKLLNKKLKIILLVFWFSFLMMNCKPIIKTLGPFSSANIEESKKRDFFLWEYYPISTVILDSIYFEIESVYAEKAYKYYSYNDLRYVPVKNLFQVNINLKEKPSMLHYKKLWTIEGCSKIFPTGIKKRYRNILPPDTIRMNILRVDINEAGELGNENEKVIGSFVLKRKFEQEDICRGLK